MEENTRDSDFDEISFVKKVNVGPNHSHFLINSD